MAVTSDQAPGARRDWRMRFVAGWGSEQVLMQRLAGTTFMIRVASAIVAYGSQVLLARWMGSYEFGIYVYVWTWVLLFGQAIDFGLSQTAQRFVPEYIERNSPELLRGFLAGSRWFSLVMAFVTAVLCAGAVRLLEPQLDHYTVIPLYLACITLPAYALANTQDGIARSYDWIGLALAPTFLFRQIGLTVLVALVYASGIPVDASSVIVISGIVIWAGTLGQMTVLNKRLRTRVEAGHKAYAFKTWLATSLPIMVVEGFYLLLSYVDILVLQQFSTPEEVAVYYAAVKTLALVSFIYWSISATTAHRFSEYHVSGQHDRLAAFLKQAIQWTFWPSLAAVLILLVIGHKVLDLFGHGFSAGYHLMVILSIGLLARAAVGPIEEFLNMLDEQLVCALVYASAFVLNLSLCLVLIPRFGASGAAAATATALVVESILLFLVTRHRLGFHVFVFGTIAKR